MGKDLTFFTDGDKFLQPGQSLAPLGVMLKRSVFLLVPILSLFGSVNCGTEDIPLITGDIDSGPNVDKDSSFGTCTSVGFACTAPSACCTKACIGGSCSNGAIDGGATACVAADAACVRGFDCCSGTCTGSKCVGSAPGPGPSGDGGSTANPTCGAPKATCTQGSQCCSGSCQPVTGQAGVIQCRDACRADGVACTNAQDCCSLGCFNGVCAAKLCILQSEQCQTNAECCSNLCDPATKKCMIDQANSTCRPSGETCNSGSQRGCCGATPGNDLCDKTNYNPPRCVNPPGLCKGQNATCAANAECCGGVCNPTTKTCAAPVCVPSAGACTTGADCCSASCTNGSCDEPLPKPGADGGGGGQCLSAGLSCTDNAQCCTTFCVGGFCFLPPR
jgi:hypothetical protein